MRKQTYEVCFSRNTVIYETPEFPAGRYSAIQIVTRFSVTVPNGCAVSPL